MSSDAPRPLEGKAGIVTGAGRGIGAAIARHLAELGANIGINYWHSLGDAEKLSAEIQKLGRGALLLPGDMAQEKVVKESIDQLCKAYGHLDFVVNNAGGNGGAEDDLPIDKARLVDFERIIASNLTSTFLTTRYAAPRMLKQKSGRIVNISSICGETGDCGPAYCAAKAGVLGLTRNAAAWLAPFVQVNAILPGFVSSMPHVPEKVARITPGRKMGHPEEIADLVGYLIASPQAFLTGACITMDGAVTNGIVSRMMDWDDVQQREAKMLGDAPAR
jgi:3-oxoacyl-[acyl-carrier protein] reductase